MVDRGASEALHERASQHYLNGEFAEALAAWEELLRLAPADERALEGTRLSRMMMPDAPAAVLPDPVRQSEGIDFGDLAGMPALGLDRTEEAAIDAALSNLGAPVAVETPAPAPPPRAGEKSLADLLDLEIDPVALPAQGEAEVSESALAPFQTTSAAAPGGPAPAAGELSRRLTELLAQAETAADAGNLDEAKAMLARVAVLDEDNIAAMALGDKIREKENETHRQIDDWIVEGVQLFEQGRPAEARANFERVLSIMPDHLEAQDYVRRIEESVAAAAAPRAVPPPATPGAPVAVEEDFLASLTAPASVDPALQGIPLAGPSPRGKAPAAAPMAAPVAPPAPVAARRLSPAVLVGAIVLLGGAGWWFLRPHEPASDIPESAQTGDREARGAKAPPSPKADPAPAAATAVLPPPLPPGDPRARVEQALARQDWSAAIVAYNEILAAAPDDVVARAGLLDAAQHYREHKALDEQLEQTRRAFQDGEYEAGLRLLYRMPKGVDPTKVEAGKVAGWVNLGIVSLKAAEPDKALQSFGEALTLRPDDTEVKKLQAFAQDAAGKPKDAAYYARVEGMEFRSLPN